MNNKLDMQTIEQFIVIDDDASTLFLCKIIIERVFNKMAVVTYNNPQHAIDYFLKIFNKSPVATVVALDINMPELSGWDVLNMLSTLDEKIIENLTVIMLSSSIDPKDEQQAASHPLVSGYFEKPLSAARLKQVMALMESTTTV